MSNTNGIVITSSGDINSIDRLQLEDMQRAVGGCVEPIDIRVAGKSCTMWVNENGKAFELPINAVATRLAFCRMFAGDYVAGDALVTGQEGPEGGTLPIDQLAAEFLFGMSRA